MASVSNQIVAGAPPEKSDGIAVDWGDNRLRAWTMARTGAVLDQICDDTGVTTATPQTFAPVLTAQIGQWLVQPTPVIISGLAGTHLVATPCPVMPKSRPYTVTTHPNLQAYIIPGLKQTDPADLMQGGATKVSGFLARHPGWDGVICLAEAQTRWVHVSAGEIVSFQTFLTATLYDAIARQTQLYDTVAAGGWDDAGFASGVDMAMTRPERLAARLFSLHAQSVLQDLPGPTTHAQLWGLLIGAELAAAKPYWLGQKIAVIGTTALASRYVAALALQGVPSQHTDATAMVQAGLTAAYQGLQRHGR